MALREFAGPDGVHWQVWNVQPARTFSPVRSGQERRVLETPGFRPERRSGSDRRRLSLTTGLERGWLCFESASEKRRLTPMPPDWETCSEEQLGRYAGQANPVQRRRTERELPRTSGGGQAQHTA